MMKKVFSIALCLLLLANVAVADYYDDYVVSAYYAPGNAPTTKLQWEANMLNYNFPVSVLRDVSDICSQYNGTWVHALCLTSTKGSNLRRRPVLYKAPKKDIITTVHASQTLYVYFKCYSDDLEWYYVASKDGTEGFFVAGRIQLFY